jgi:hypothetical protein
LKETVYKYLYNNASEAAIQIHACYWQMTMTMAMLHPPTALTMAAAKRTDMAWMEAHGQCVLLEMVRLVKNAHTCMDNATTDNIWPLKPTARRIMALTRAITFLPTETVAFKDMNMIPVDIIILVNISMAVFALKRIITRANAAQAT